eukprot:CAMPEP_0170173080 /NCGR_PEP_ID=MMETSP0040_2-20121228/6355_1 /TAXON_ID=641309 /ORGANISM="Lotharella oceanica, Strain CCMP622" /LENGTH=67 /DNA_ID=CAMNT_0010414081 /DNA_START=296 /DNA_END=499 /DNA_ORIENTATION=+
MAPRPWEVIVANQEHWDAEDRALREQLDAEKKSKSGGDGGNKARRVVWVDGGAGNALDVVMNSLFHA